MLGPADESVGQRFSPDLLQKARDLTLKVITDVKAQVRPGITEAQVKDLLAETQKQLGSPRTWHPPQIRFGANTILPFGVPGKPNLELQDNDICFFDIGPVFEDHEGDVGRSFSFGNNPDHRRCCEDVESLWNIVRNHWKLTQATGAELYQFAALEAQKLGWQLSLQKANGHRIADFPHAAQQRGSIEGFGSHPAENRWILEIQIRHPQREFGAFYEDLLN